MRFRVLCPLTGSFALEVPIVSAPTTWHMTKRWTNGNAEEKGDDAGTLTLRAPESYVSMDCSRISTLFSRERLPSKRYPTHISFLGEASYRDLYWEWLEKVSTHCRDILDSIDLTSAVLCSRYSYEKSPEIMKAFLEAWCSDTNVLEISMGPISISLWDLYSIAGLPINGCIYEEVVPSRRELRDSGNGRRFFYSTCSYLFKAYTHLALSSSSRTVSIDAWIRYWFGGKSKYKASTRKLHRDTAGFHNHDPWGEIKSIPAPSWDTAELDLFHKLGIEEASQKVTYLAAFLCCWLCDFVFPEKGDYIRPRTFKIATIMAHGNTVNLATPVLTRIYRGLREFTNSACTSKTYIPWHYVYGWLAAYFGTHHVLDLIPPGPKMTLFSGDSGARRYSITEARALIHVGGSISWEATVPRRYAGYVLKDDHTLPTDQRSFLTSLCPHTLVCRDFKVFFMENYNPLYFSRQFGYCQGVPRISPISTRQVPLVEGWSVWHSVIQKTSNILEVPAFDHDELMFTKPFPMWWKRRNGNYLLGGKGSGIWDLLPPTTACLDRVTDKVLKVNVGNETNVNRVSSEVIAGDEVGTTRLELPPITIHIDQPPKVALVRNQDSSSSDVHPSRKRKSYVCAPTVDDAADPNLANASKGGSTSRTASARAAPIEIEGDAESSYVSPYAHLALPAPSGCVTTFDATSHIRACASALWKPLREKLELTAYKKLPSIEVSIRPVIDALVALYPDKGPILQDLVNNYFSHAKGLSALDGWDGLAEAANRATELSSLRAQLKASQDSIADIAHQIDISIPHDIESIDATIHKHKSAIRKLKKTKREATQRLEGLTADRDRLTTEVTTTLEKVTTLSESVDEDSTATQSFLKVKELVEDSRARLFSFEF